MKSYELVTIPPQPERLETRVIAIICDICQIEIQQLLADGTITLNPLLRDGYGNAFSVLIAMRAGENNLDGGVGETTTFDICPTCFDERLRVWLEGQGATARVEAWSD